MTTQNKRLRIYAMTDGRCYYCGDYLSLSPIVSPKTFTVDHVTPMSHGGTQHIDNLVPSCQRCNTSKGPRRVEVFRAWLAWLKVECKPFSVAQTEYLARMGVDVDAILPKPEPFYGEVTRGEVVTDGAPEYVEYDGFVAEPESLLDNRRGSC